MVLGWELTYFENRGVARFHEDVAVPDTCPYILFIAKQRHVRAIGLRAVAKQVNHVARLEVFELSFELRVSTVVSKTFQSSPLP